MRLSIVLLCLAGNVVLAGCGEDAPSSKSAAPAKVEKLPVETEIGRITLTPEAEQRLGITLATATIEQMPRRRTFGGEITVPGGKSIIVSSPVAATIMPPDGSSIPLPGESVTANTAVLSLAPLLTPERDVPTPAERVQMANARATLLSALTVATGDVERGQAEVDAAKIALDRAKELFTDKAGSARAVDEAQAQFNIATATLKAAQDRQKQLEGLLAELEPSSGGSQAERLSMKAPHSGVIRSLSVSPGQTVGQGAALFEVIDTSTMWIRVPLYVDMLDEIDRNSAAELVGLGKRSDQPENGHNDAAPPKGPDTAQPVTAPPSADPLSTSADLFYEVANPNQQYRPGQRVGVSLKLKGETESLVVPAKAILFDIYGGTWVYVKSGDHAFERNRVLIRYSTNGLCVLDSGPPPGTQVVVDGAAELFGTEFGAGK